MYPYLKNTKFLDKDIFMPAQTAYNHFIFSKDSIQLVPAVIISLLIIVGAWYINRFLQKTIVTVSQQNNLEETLVKAISNLSYLFIYALAAMLFLENLHVHMSAVFGTLGVVAIGVGFALQKAMANMTSGMFLLFYKPFFIGDYIISDKPKFQGKIIDINLRMTTLEWNGDIVLVPNHTLYSAVVIVKKQK
jgi:small-conductance mechanosensitive channel